MSEDGNGVFKPVQIDVTDDRAFKTHVVQYLQLISDQTSVIPSLKKKVERHERLIQYGKWTAIPLIAALHGLVDQGLKKYFGGH